jgi:ribosomal protein L12E/L44/L45/RPP1/RPP2
MMTTTDYLHFHRRITPPITPPGVTPAGPRAPQGEGAEGLGPPQKEEEQEEQELEEEEEDVSTTRR